MSIKTPAFGGLWRSVGFAVGLSSVALMGADSTPMPPMPPITPPVSQLPLAEILATDPTALIGSSSGALTVLRTGASTNDLVVHYTIAGTASNGVDYVRIPDEVTIPHGFLAADIVIQPLANAQKRGNKTVVLTLTTNSAYQLHGHAAANVSLVDDLYNNQPPVVALTSPADGTVFPLPSVVTLTATATDSDDTIARVSFYANDRFLGSATQSPFTLSWTNPPMGSYALFARAVDAVGKSTLSAPVNITVSNAPPVVTLVSPANGAIFTLPANITIKATATDNDDSVAKVQIYGDSHLLTTLTNGPYTTVWTNVSVGTHYVIVRAIDTFGLSATASARITVSNAPPTVTLTSPTTGANFPAHSDITMSATASDSDDAVVRVTFTANGHTLGSVTQTPYTFIWTNAPSGLYSIRATATDTYGLKTTSEGAVISISR